MFSASLLALVVSGCAVTSEPIDRSVSEQRAKSDMQTMFKDQEPLNGPLTLHEAMARAVKYNLEGRLKIMEEALAKRQLDLASFGHAAAHGAVRRLRPGVITSVLPAARTSRPASNPWSHRPPRTATVVSAT